MSGSALILSTTEGDFLKLESGMEAKSGEIWLLGAAGSNFWMHATDRVQGESFYSRLRIEIAMNI